MRIRIGPAEWDWLKGMEIRIGQNELGCQNLQIGPRSVYHKWISVK